MARQPKQRKNYMADANNMLLLARAIEADSNRPNDWRNTMVTRLQSLAMDLIDAPKKED